MRMRGYTVVEMVITLAVIMLALSVGVPSFRALVADAGVSGLASHYLHAYNSARYAAVVARRPVSICHLGDADRCSGDWGKSMAVFYDDERDGRLATPADLIDLVHLEAPGDVTVNFRAFGRTRYVSLRADGRYRQNGTFRFCPRAGGSGRAIVINVTGRARTQKIRCD